MINGCNATTDPFQNIASSLVSMLVGLELEIRFLYHVQKIEMQVFFRQKEIYFNSDPGAHASKITRWETCYISSISRKVNSFFLKTSR